MRRSSMNSQDRLPCSSPIPADPFHSPTTTTAAVSVHLYDLSNGRAKKFSSPLMKMKGIWHTGVVVDWGGEIGPVEYYFGAGVIAERAGCTAYGTPCRSIDAGRCTRTPLEFAQFLVAIEKERFSSANYNIFRQNCNHFTDTCLKFLVGEGLEEEILHLPSRLLRSPLGCLSRPFLHLVLCYYRRKGLDDAAKSFDPRVNLQINTLTSMFADLDESWTGISTVREMALLAKIPCQFIGHSLGARSEENFQPLFVNPERRCFARKDALSSFGLSEYDANSGSPRYIEALARVFSQTPASFSVQSRWVRALDLISASINQFNVSALHVLLLKVADGILTKGIACDFGTDMVGLHRSFLTAFSNLLATLNTSKSRDHINASSRLSSAHHHSFWKMFEIAMSTMHLFHTPWIIHRLVRFYNTVMLHNVVAWLHACNLAFDSKKKKKNNTDSNGFNGCSGSITKKDVQKALHVALASAIHIWNEETHPLIGLRQLVAIILLADSVQPGEQRESLLNAFHENTVFSAHDSRFLPMYQKLRFIKDISFDNASSSGVDSLSSAEIKRQARNKSASQLQLPNHRRLSLSRSADSISLRAS
eukprot:ANDGO_03080.mRNA.1 thioredoxin family protein